MVAEDEECVWIQHIAHMLRTYVNPVCHNEVIENAVRRIVSNVRAEKAHFHEHTRFRSRAQQWPSQLPAVGGTRASKQEAP